jgi:hydrogenase-4 component B
MIPIFLRDFFSFDGLSVFFLAVIGLVCLPSLVYAAGYFRSHYSGRRAALAFVLSSLFVLSLCLVVISANLLVFFMAWELMSLISYFLVVFDHEHEQSVHAGLIYIVMTHIAAACILAGMLIMYRHSGALNFDQVRQSMISLPAATKNIVFILFLIGFGTKAGIVPLHIWLPYAHPQAPSPVSSIMSGVMIKLGIYGILRFVLGMLGTGESWWSGLILTLAILSCLVGVIYALMDHDLKKLLAYHSVENIGIILLGVGAAMAAYRSGLTAVAVLALAAGLYHLVNHAVFKGLLFLGAGSVVSATGTRNIEKLGGLIKRMPVTAATFLIGSLAISAVPPLNGFVSEWLLLQSFFHAARHSLAGHAVVFGLCAAGLALTGGLAAACFVKAFGITFLAMPRSKKAEEARESPASMQIAMIFLAALCFVLSFGVAIILPYLVRISAGLLNVDQSSVQFSFNRFILRIPESVAQSPTPIQFSPLVLACVLSAAAALTFVLVRILCGPGRRTIYNTWDCGYYKLTAANEYTATAFSKPFRIAFSFFLQPYRRSEKLRDSYYHVRKFSYEVFFSPVFKMYFYDPIVKFVMRSAHGLRRIQPGSIHIYLAYIFITMLCLILWLARI